MRDVTADPDGQLSDRELLSRSGSDPEAFGVLFERHFDKIFGYIFRRVGSWDAARDLTSEVFLKALRTRWRFRWTGAPVSAWLYAIATNEIRMYLRSGRRAPVSLDALISEAGIRTSDALVSAAREQQAEAELRLEQSQEFERTRIAMLKLPIKYQEVIALRFFEERSIAEIAVVLGKREGTVKSLLSRGLSLLRDMLAEDTMS